jgi:hypothetical protein
MRAYTTYRLEARRTLARWVGLCVAIGCLALFGGSRAMSGAAEGGTPDRSKTVEEWQPPTGRWHALRTRETRVAKENLTEEQKAEIERLESIGYLGASQPAPETSGVTVYDRDRAAGGLNFYVSGHAPGAVLMDMEGKVLHGWGYEYNRNWPNYPPDEYDEDEDSELARSRNVDFWRRAYLYEDGSLLAVFEGLALIKIDKDSNLLWTYFGGCHHDLDVTDDGRIYVLCREAKVVPSVNRRWPILEDYVAVLDSNGKELSKVSLLTSFKRSHYASLLTRMKRKGDVFHTNTIEVLDGRLAGALPSFEAGNVLISILKLDVIAVVDLDIKKAVWALDGMWHEQHQPTVLPNGNMLVFDNKGNRGVSRVIEFDPVTQEFAWLYERNDPNEFYSATCGSAQRLANGNTLISESDGGRAFEVMPDGRIVWEFINPARGGPDGELIATLFEVVRLDPDFPVDWAVSE